jgi:putative membrane protein insertion efficiency factor
MKYLLILFVRVYQKTLSKVLPPSCRFTPSCSEYAIIAIRRFGAVRGGYLAFLRIVRCNPFSAGGLDEVPLVFSFFRKKDQEEKK